MAPLHTDDLRSPIRPRRRSLLASGTALAAASLTLGGISAASASTSRPPAGMPHVIVTNLHTAYAARLGHTRAARITGVVPPLRAHAGVMATAGCSEPNCRLVYNGGPVQHSPHVYLLFWGPTWSTSSNEETSASYLESFYAGLGVQPEDDWSTITDQYSDGSGHPSFTGSVYVGAFHDTSTPPTGATQGELAAEADAFTSTQGITDLNDAQIVIATQSGTCPQGFYAPSCSYGSGNYCAWHSKSNEPYTNLPYVLDSGSGCGEDFVNANGTEDGFSVVGGHEYAETVTDPDAFSGWIDYNDGISGGEIADKCAWGGELWGSRDPYGNVTLSTGSFAMQSLWSNAADACSMSIGHSADTVTVTSPGSNLNSATDGRYDLRIVGSSSEADALRWSGTGLPSGLSIGSSTGVISGKFSAVGSYSVKVTARDTAGASGSTSFTWMVRTALGTAIKGYDFMCLDDLSSWEMANNPVDLYTCNSTGAQVWSFYGGHLRVFGMCLADTGGSGTTVYISDCTAAYTQVWTHPSNGEYVLKSNGLCLTDPGSSKTAGTRQQLLACTDATSQKWWGT